MDATPILTIAMTTAPRRAPTLTRALTSLREAGFGEIVHLFAEPGTFDQTPRPIDERTIVSEHVSTLGCFGNWKHAITYLLAATSAQWLLVVQDDAIWAAGSADALRAELATRKNQRIGFLSPYVTESDVPVGAADGWIECRSGWNLCGAVALCLERGTARQLLWHRRFVEHRSTEHVDSVVAASMLDLGRPSYVHVPSLVDHVGYTSTIGHDDVAPKLRGYRFGEK